MQPSENAVAQAAPWCRWTPVSARSNLELIHDVRDELRALGVASRPTCNADCSKARLFATLGEGKPAGVIVCGYRDTVPWDGPAWSVEPLSATVMDGRRWGRGAADMKGFIGVAQAQAQRFLESDAAFTVHLAFSYDEEVGCLGVREPIADLREASIAPLVCIIGEPTGRVPAIAHKGVRRRRCSVRGKEAHSSLTPQSVSAIEMAAPVIGMPRDMAERLEREEPRYAGFDVPFSTVSVGQFHGHGGIADDMVPRDAESRHELHDPPTADATAMQREVEAAAAALRAVSPGSGALPCHRLREAGRNRSYPP